MTLADIDWPMILAGLGLFLFGIEYMGDGLKGYSGDKMKDIIDKYTSSPFKGIVIGAFVTCLIQSSSGTTALAIGLIRSGLMTLEQSIGIIMGANIGTTVTAWLISALGFKVDIAAFALPLLAFALPLFFSGKKLSQINRRICLWFRVPVHGASKLKGKRPGPRSESGDAGFRAELYGYGIFSIILFLFIGAILTMIVQASAATMAITLIMCANGWIDYHLGVALVLGENIGTTITANLAALTGNTQARRAALAHLVFNVFGVMWVLVLFYPFTNAVSWFVTHVMKVSDPAVAVSFKLAAFHTAFNISNTFIMIWFVSLIEKTVCTLIKPKVEDEEYRLRYITGGMLSTAELSILQAHKEISLFAERTARMLIW